ncbi:MAG: hypothetical protein CMF46_00815 [Legionellales bacterium]|nr:hypothetical protein [Legionellales bacterium]|tara:strand:- start:618 stop:1379 length:762 start_codon:yes stop_codon:yes gene_type:complete
MSHWVDENWKALLSQIGFTVRDLWQNPSVQSKPDGQPVTNVDYAVQDLIVTFLSKHYSADLCVSEENLQTVDTTSSPRVWLVDPIDGTRSLIKGKPEFSVSIALIDHGRLTMAVVYNPILDVIYWLEDGKSLYHQGRSRSRDSRPVVLTSHQHHKIIARQLNDVTCYPVGSIAERMAMTAVGFADATIGLFDMHKWDVAAGTMLAESTGHIVTCRQGDQLDWGSDSMGVGGVVVAKPDLHQKILQAVGRINNY